MSRQLSAISIINENGEIKFAVDGVITDIKNINNFSLVVWGRYEPAFDIWQQLSPSEYHDLKDKS